MHLQVTPPKLSPRIFQFSPWGAPANTTPPGYDYAKIMFLKTFPLQPRHKSVADQNVRKSRTLFKIHCSLHLVEKSSTLMITLTVVIKQFPTVANSVNSEIVPSSNNLLTKFLELQNHNFTPTICYHQCRNRKTYFPTAEFKNSRP